MEVKYPAEDVKQLKEYKMRSWENTYSLENEKSILNAK
jgi:hypothetical protein